MNYKKIYGIILMAFIFTYGFLSVKNLIEYYVYDEIYDNQTQANEELSLENDIATTIYGKLCFVDLNGLIRRIIDQQTMNDVVKLDNNYLTTVYEKCDEKVLDEYADNVSKFNNYLSSRGISLVYATTPYTVSKYDCQLPVGVDDYGNDNIDYLMRALEKKGVETIDFRASFYDDGISQYDMMYRTDHHWTNEAGFYAFLKLQQYIVDKEECEINRDVLDLSNYSFVNKDRCFLGSRGKRTGKYYAGLDDFSIIVPNFNTTLQDEQGNIGKIEDLILNCSVLEQNDMDKTQIYASAFEQSQNHFYNLESKNDINIFMIGDSFSQVVNPYLAISFGEIDFWRNSNVEQLTPDIIESVNPDIVIMLYYPQYLYPGNDAYNFSQFD